MRRIWFLLVVLGLLVIVGGCAKKKIVKKAAPPVMEEMAEEEPEIDPKFLADQQIVREVLASEHSWDRDHTVLVVHKQTRKMSVFKGIKPIKMYSVVLGHNSWNDKMEQGDRCTPEGIYKVVYKYPHPKWSKFILLNYPTPANWRKFAEAKRRGLIPWDAQIGGDIGIHGTEDDLANRAGINWTYGCIALTNRDINELYRLIHSGSIVVIERK